MKPSTQKAPKDLTQPEVELVNTRSNNGAMRAHNHEPFELDVDLNSETDGSTHDHILRSISLCHQLLKSKLFEKDKFLNPLISQTRPTSQKFTSKTTIGLVMKGCIVSELVPGGPAHSCGELAAGDKILQVNGEEVSDENISLKLIGDDIPETEIILTVSSGREGSCKQVALVRSPAGIIGDRVRLFELFAAQKELAVVEEKSKGQCQALLDHLLSELMEARRSLEEQILDVQEQELKHRASNSEAIKSMKQDLEGSERQAKEQMQAIMDLKRELDQKKQVEKELRSELLQSESVASSLQSVLDDMRMNLKTTGTAAQDQRVGLSDLFVATKVELDKTKEGLRLAKQEAVQSRAALADLEEDLCGVREDFSKTQIELEALKMHEREMQKSILESAEQLDKIQNELSLERRRADDEFRSSLAKDVALAKLKEEISDIRRKYEDLKNHLPSASDVADSYLARITDLNHRCLGLQDDVNTILILHNRLFEAICRTPCVKPCGIGVRLRALADASPAGPAGTVLIDSVFDGGAAALSQKVVVGDVLMKIDGCEVQGLAMEDVRRRIVGLPGTTLTLHIRRGGPGATAATHVVELTRSGGVIEAPPNLEEQTDAACEMAESLYASLEQERWLVEEALTEKEALKKSFAMREEEVLKAVSKWAENYQGQQLAKFFKAWARGVLRGVVHKQKSSIIRKSLGKNLLSNAFSQMSSILARRRKCQELDRLLDRLGKAGYRRFWSWRVACGLYKRAEWKASQRSRQRQGCLVRAVLDGLGWDLPSAGGKRGGAVLKAERRATQLASMLAANQTRVARSCFAEWRALTGRAVHVRFLSLRAQKKATRAATSAVFSSWLEITRRIVHIRLRARRLLGHTVGRAVQRCFSQWCWTTLARSLVLRSAARREAESYRRRLGWAVATLQFVVGRRRRSQRARERVSTAVRRRCGSRVLGWWAKAAATSRRSLQVVSHRWARWRWQQLDFHLSGWMRLVQMKGDDSAGERLRAQEAAFRSTETGLVKQIAHYSDRLGALQGEVAAGSRSLKEEVQRNAELEAALANARDEIGAYCQQVEYLRRQVRDAWAASDTARTDLSAAIKSSDQMRNALFGRADGDLYSSAGRQPDSALKAKGDALRASLMSPIPRRLDTSDFTDV